MKKLEKFLRKEYITVKFFLEDLILIEEILKEFTNDFEIKTKDYSFSSVEEFSKEFSNQRLTNVEILARNPYISLELDKSSVRLYCSSNDLMASGLFYKIDEIVSSRTRKPNFLYYFPVYWVGFFLLSWVHDLFGYGSNKLVLLFETLYFLAFLRVSYLRFFKSGVIILSKKGDLGNFFSRNKDQLVTGVIISVISFVLGIIVKNYIN